MTIDGAEAGDRRQVLAFIAAALACASPWKALAAQRGDDRSPPTVRLPPFDLRADRQTLAALSKDIQAYKLSSAGKNRYSAWLRTSRDQYILLSIDQRDVAPMFEVFSLQALSLEELVAAWRAWTPRPVPEGAPAFLKELLTTRPPRPAAPSDFQPWPFASWRTKLLRRAEFIVMDPAPGPTFGRYGNTQSIARPGAVPAEATAFCEVAAGLLFVGLGGDRLLMGLGDMPMSMTVTNNPAEIDSYLENCEVTDLLTYLDQPPP